MIHFLILIFQAGRTKNVDKESKAFVDLEGFGLEFDKLLDKMWSTYVTANCFVYPKRCKNGKFRHAIDFIEAECGYQKLFDSLAGLLHNRAFDGIEKGNKNGKITPEDIESSLKTWYKRWPRLMSIWPYGVTGFPTALSNGMEKMREAMVAQHNLNQFLEKTSRPSGK